MYMSYQQHATLARLKHEELLAIAARERLYKQLHRPSTLHLSALVSRLGMQMRHWFASQPTITVKQANNVSRPQAG